jgi:hypothetical protein
MALILWFFVNIRLMAKIIFNQNGYVTPFCLALRVLDGYTRSMLYNYCFDHEVIILIWYNISYYTTNDLADQET